MSGKIIDFFSQKPFEALALQTSNSMKPKQPYVPFELAEETPATLQLMKADRSICLLPYGYLHHISFNPHQKYIHLLHHFMGKGKAEIWWGDHLDQLIEPLQNFKIKTVRTFNPNTHLVPDSNQPVIRCMETAGLARCHEIKNGGSPKH